MTLTSLKSFNISDALCYSLSKLIYYIKRTSIFMVKNENLKVLKDQSSACSKVMLVGLIIFMIFIMNLLFNYWICAGHRVFYKDDLAYVNYLLDAGSFLEVVFYTGANKMRPVAYIFLGLVFNLARNNYEIIDEILLALNFVNALLVYWFIYVIQHKKEFIQRNIMSLVGASLFIASRFAYYNISEFLGLMEGLGIAFSIGMLLSLYLYLNIGGRKYIVGATILYLLAIYTHERYFVLFICFIVVSLLKKTTIKSKIMMALPAIVLVLSFWVIRIVLFGNRAIDGTGGKSISDTFDIKTAIKFCFSHVGYILGFNCGPPDLNGINAAQVSAIINILLVFNLLCVLSIVILYVRLLISNKQFRNEHLKNIILFIVFIALCIISSSTTIRVEMRWIYTPYAAFIILLSYMVNGVLEYCPLNPKALAVFAVYFISVLITEQYYREHYRYIYYWPVKDMSRELYDITVDQYSDNLANMNIIIVSEHKYLAAWDDEQWESFFRPYLDADGISVYYVEKVSDVEELMVSMESEFIILTEDVDNKSYTDITNCVD